MTPSPSVPSPTFTMYICTRNRHADLKRALLATCVSTYPIHQIIVSDDSTDALSRDMVLRDFPDVVFVEGPRRGLSANRNNALHAVTGSHILFIDDDAVIRPDFFEKMAGKIATLGADRARVIVTGTEFTHGEQVFAHKPDFLGYQSIDYAPGETMVSTVINAAVFPTQLFQHIKFDENLIYGHEELDISLHAVLVCGYRIELLAEAVNDHYPSIVNRDYYAPFTEASRIYATFKRYHWLDEKALKAYGYLAIALMHNCLYTLKKRRKFASFVSTARTSLGYIGRHAANRPKVARGA